MTTPERRSRPGGAPAGGGGPRADQVPRSLAGAVGPDEEYGQDGWLGSRVAPAVARPVLHHGVAWAEHLLGPVVQLEDHLTGQDHLEVDRVSGMHPRVVRL